MIDSLTAKQALEADISLKDALKIVTRLSNIFFHKEMLFFIL